MNDSIKMDSTPVESMHACS